jgi:tetratricopeptide (TPR) repeat protein
MTPRPTTTLNHCVSARVCTLFCALFCALLAACASAPTAPNEALANEAVSALLHDSLFAPPAAPVDKAVFALNDNMRRFAQAHLLGLHARDDPRQALLDALRQSNLRLNYDAATTRNAAEAFEARAGNCLSLVLMTAAFAKHLNLPLTFQSINADTLYSRSGDLTLASGHVNMVLERLPPKAAFSRARTSDLLVDFLPPEELRGQSTKPLPERALIAMYLNNRAAEHLAEGQLSEAYHWAREALLHDPGFGGTMNTLAVIYLRVKQPQHAQATLQYLLGIEPNNTAALSNLVLAYNRSGQPKEAAAVQARLTALQPLPPLHHFDLGRQAADKGDWSLASELFARELRRQPYQPEVHFWAAVAHWRLGEHKAATKHMRLAMENSNSLGTHALYAAKLEKLRSLNAH